MSTDALKLTEATLPGQGVSDPGGLAQGHLHGLAYYATPDNHPDVHFVSPMPVPPPRGNVASCCLVGLKPDLQCGVPSRSGFSPTRLLAVYV
jgi:hypothetical protein